MSHFSAVHYPVLVLSFHVLIQYDGIKNVGNLIVDEQQEIKDGWDGGVYNR